MVRVGLDIGTELTMNTENRAGTEVRISGDAGRDHIVSGVMIVGLSLNGIGFWVKLQILCLK